jgi:hypothetical protein
VVDAPVDDTPVVDPAVAGEAQDRVVCAVSAAVLACDLPPPTICTR